MDDYIHDNTHVPEKYSSGYLYYNILFQKIEKNENITNNPRV